jgi:hypothetical protein
MNVDRPTPKVIPAWERDTCLPTTSEQWSKDDNRGSHLFDEFVRGNRSYFFGCRHINTQAAAIVSFNAAAEGAKHVRHDFNISDGWNIL